VLPRTAWSDEARDFTPWLARNLGFLGKELGLELELIKAEAGLPSQDDDFSADILARNVHDDSNVLIENQLEKSDHRHLGQILTYLAGLEAKAIIWVAPGFREAHLAAIKWLNENTSEDFAFFAVRLRVVRIGASPFAPLFDVLEKPNAWERRLQTVTRAAKTNSPLADARRRFWHYFFEHYPENAGDGSAGGHSNQWRKCGGGRLIISYYLAKGKVGLFVRGLSDVSHEETAEILAPYHAELTNRLGEYGLTRSGGLIGQSLPCDFADESQFPTIGEWLNERVSAYERTLNELFGDAV
jgi:hypothetical protein